MKFDDRPDYGFLRRLFKTIFEKEKIEPDNDFDWFKLTPTEKEEVTKIDEAIIPAAAAPQKKETTPNNTNNTVNKNSNTKLNSYKSIENKTKPAYKK